ncbi:MAG TPA: cytochrome c oxidase subunit 3 [Chitinophagales bacterium]|nr:cytochrome c oxidase subunit 3 [Chitinophagales bacterium]
MQAALSNDNILRDKTEYTGVHPQKFGLWVGMGSMAMFFAALTSALLIKKGDFRVWENFRLPSIFLYNTLVIVSVSVMMQLALISYRKAKFFAFRTLMILSFITACVFLGLQLWGWHILKQMGLPIDGNVAGSFVYLLTSMHGVHIVVGLLVTLVFIVYAVRARKDPIYELRNIINPKRQLNLELLVSYWHFVDAIWVYLFIFFYMNYQ